MTPKDLYRTCRVSAFRLEAQQHYEVPGDEDRQRAFHAGEPLPPPRDELLDDLRLITELRRTGRQVGRVHVVDRPLTPYVRYELAVYAENAAAGEDVRIADRSPYPGLAGIGQDFALFDVQTPDASAILFDYDAGGRLRGYTHAQDEETINRCWTQFHLALSMSVSLAEFVAAAAA